MHGGAGERSNTDEQGAEHGPDRTIERLSRDGRCGEKSDARANGGASKLRRGDPAAVTGKEAAGSCPQQPANHASDHDSLRAGRVANDGSADSAGTGQEARGEKQRYSIHRQCIDVM